MTTDLTSWTGSPGVQRRASFVKFATDEAHVEAREPEGDLIPPTVDAAALRDHLSDLGKDFGLELKILTGRRRYRDSTDFHFDHRQTWCDVRLFSGNRSYNVSVRDGTDDVVLLPNLLAGMAQELLTQRERRSLPVYRIPHSSTVVLRPNLAGILVHELIGHLLEETDPKHVGPKGFSVEAQGPPGRAFDDFGEPVQHLFLVKDGVVSRRDRRERGRGFAQAGWHQGPPIVRFTDLTVSSCTSSGAMPQDEFVVCHRSRGAELVGQRALVSVDDAELVRDGVTVGRLRPFLFTVDAEGLTETMVALLGNSVPGRAGMCVKAGQSLPTRVTSPSIVLNRVALYEIA
ncbi:hypothetical protein KIK06_24935 [Nocardiopsis sp. EMB25]|uniref:hypothetical protein n=1 Tax=Nocardiopsis sp. EMB25 TaxID=2835867 RepID=UPI0022835658|nr:hypothetical protein [Nocardiopsis sp. EMB25]MCY9787135.1 hypothetical protein [Nocardiopsis sp. EMB25]